MIVPDYLAIIGIILAILVPLLTAIALYKGHNKLATSTVSASITQAQATLGRERFTHKRSMLEETFKKIGEIANAHAARIAIIKAAIEDYDMMESGTSKLKLSLEDQAVQKYADLIRPEVMADNEAQVSLTCVVYGYEKTDELSDIFVNQSRSLGKTTAKLWMSELRALIENRSRTELDNVINRVDNEYVQLTESANSLRTIISQQLFRMSESDSEEQSAA